MTTIGHDSEHTEFAIYWEHLPRPLQIQVLGDTRSRSGLEAAIRAAHAVIAEFAQRDPDRPRGVIVSRVVHVTAWED
jgi:hypothetical protein